MLRRKMCNFLAALFSVVFIFPLVFMITDRELPVSLHYGSITPTVDSGGKAVVTWTAQLHRKFGDGLFECDGNFIRRITDSGGFVFDTKFQRIESFRLLNGKSEGTFNKEIVMPIMLPGPATYQVFMTYWCNPVQKYIWPITVSGELLRFHVNAVLAPLSTQGVPGIPGVQGGQGDQGIQGIQGPQGERGPAGQDAR